MSIQKLSNIQLEQLVREGKGVSMIARKLGVTKGAVSKRLKALKVAIAKDVTLLHAGQIVEKKIDAIEQLQKINESANEILSQTMRRLRGEQDAIGDGDDQNFKNNPRELALKAMGEIRGQLKLQLEIFKALYDLAAVAEFQKEVLTAIGEVAPDVRDKILHNLQKTRAIRSTLDFSR
jgi:AcrR family transcriptional regulator